MFEKLGKFEIKRVLGNGAMGEVYLGVDPSIGREVAIKTILPAAAQGGEAKERFAREARAAGVLNHPNLVTIYEFGEDQGVLYIAMEFVKGHDLDELLQEQSLTRSEALEVLAQVCDGLGFAHRQHIVHRDIKPTNVRVQRDGRRLHAKVMDFGVAKISNSDMTATGMVMGTVSYMAPEYIRTGKPDPRSDLFAVGVMLYECLSGRKPFSGDTTPTVLYKIVNEPPDPIETEKAPGHQPRHPLRAGPLPGQEPGRALPDRGGPRQGPARREGSLVDRASWRRPPRSSRPPRPRLPARPCRSPPPPRCRLRPPSRPPRGWPPLRPGPPAGTGDLARPRGPGPCRRRRHRLVGPPPDQRPRRGRRARRSFRPASKVEAPHPAPDGPPPAAGRRPATRRPRRPNPRPPGRPQVAEPAAAEARPQEPRPPAPKTAEPRAIDQPELYQPEKLDKLQTHERLNLGNVSLSEAIQLADSQPDKAIYGFRQAIKADPYNVNAHAWLAVVLHDQGRHGGVRPGTARGPPPGHPGSDGHAQRPLQVRLSPRPASTGSSPLIWRIDHGEAQRRAGRPGGRAGLPVLGPRPSSGKP